MFCAGVCHYLQMPFVNKAEPCTGNAIPLRYISHLDAWKDYEAFTRVCEWTQIGAIQELASFP